MHKTTLKIMATLIAILLAAHLLYAVDNNRQQALNYFKSAQEPKIKDAIWAMDWLLKLGVVNDGTDREQLAQYACMVLGDYDLRGKNITIQIIDINKLIRKKEWVKLGEYQCK